MTARIGSKAFAESEEASRDEDRTTPRVGIREGAWT